MLDPFTNRPGEPAPLAFRPREAAKALGIGERLLWDLTKRNEVPHARIGRAVVYPVDGLRAWLTAKAKGGAGDA